MTRDWKPHWCVATDHSGRSPVPAAPALVWFGSDSSAGGSSAWASRGPPRCSPPSRLSVAASLASPRSLSPTLKTKRRGSELALKVGQVTQSYWQEEEADCTWFSWTFCGRAECALGCFCGRHACKMENEETCETECQMFSFHPMHPFKKKTLL